MRKLSFIILFVTIAIIASAQTSGGQIVRKPKIDNSVDKRGQSKVPFYSQITQNGINRNIDGVVLGMSTKQQVINRLKEKNMPYKYTEGGDVIMSFKDNTFGGVMWFAIYYRFYKDIVFKVTFSKYANNSDVYNSNIDSEFSALKRSLSNKYRSYYTDVTYKRMFSNTILFNDEKTEIELGKGYFEGTYMMNLVYTDFFYQEKQFEKNDNDL